jgi:two-component system response regulator YesN
VELEEIMAAKTVLVADDDARIRQLICELFENECHYELCEQARDGNEAVEFAKRWKPDVIILDFVMPVTNGVETAKTLKKLLPGVPIILFTWHDEVLFQQLGFVGTVVDRIVRKTDTATLIEHVRELAPVYWD